jgi:hypothetical protein
MSQTKQSSDAAEAKNTSQAQSLKGVKHNVEPEHPTKSATDLKAAQQQNILKMLTGSYDAQWCDKAPAMIEFRDSFTSCAESKKVHETNRSMTHITAPLATFEALMVAARANEQKARATAWFQPVVNVSNPEIKDTI